MPKILISLFFSFLLTLISSKLFAQIFPAKNYPKDYFVYPVGAKVALSANYGELRPNHYHMGLDCKTDQKQNLPICAAAQGYIAKVKIEPYGFGRAIYINHPNGLTTLYAHLNDFFPALESYVKSEQYRLEQWNVFLDIPPHLFPVSKKQFIAYSGNTGGSQGPHLHFEIRDTKTDKVLNPLLFGFPIPDNVPPLIKRLALYDRRMSTYEQSPRFVSLKKDKGVYTTPLLIANTDFVSFAVSATDSYSGSSNPNGIYEAIIYLDGKALSGFQLDNISYNETRYMNAHIDHKLKLNGGPYVQHLSRLPGYPEGVYRDAESDGVINLSDDNVHEIKIDVKDTYGNTSVIRFNVRRGNVADFKNSSTISGQEVFHPGYVNVFEREDIQIVLGEKDLYDSLRFNYSRRPAQGLKQASDLHIVHTGAVPVQGYYTIRLKPSFLLRTVDRSRMVIQRKWGSKEDVVKAVEEGDWLSAKFRAFGNFQLLIDDEPPTINPMGLSDNANLSRATAIRFGVKDNLDEIKNFRAELDGKWLRFSNDKGRTFTYIFDEKCPRGSHELKISVEDEAGNKTVRTFRFTR